MVLWKDAPQTSDDPNSGAWETSVTGHLHHWNDLQPFICLMEMDIAVLEASALQRGLSHQPRPFQGSARQLFGAPEVP